jgi:hypothetical protein
MGTDSLLAPNDFGHEMRRTQCEVQRYLAEGDQKTSARSTEEPNKTPDAGDWYPNWTTCEACGRWPAITVKIRLTGGYIVFRTLKSTRPVSLCKECGLSALRSGQIRSAVGVATLNLFALYALAQNEIWIARLNRPRSCACEI